MPGTRTHPVPPPELMDIEEVYRFFGAVEDRETGIHTIPIDFAPPEAFPRNIYASCNACGNGLVRDSILTTHPNRNADNVVRRITPDGRPCSCSCGQHRRITVGANPYARSVTAVDFFTVLLYACMNCCSHVRCEVVDASAPTPHCGTTCPPSHRRSCTDCAGYFTPRAGYRVIERCRCCADSTRCVACCNHRRCCSSTDWSIRFTRRPLVFWTPTVSAIVQVDAEPIPTPPKPYYSAFDADTSAEVVKRTYSARHHGPQLDLRRFSRHSSRRYSAAEIEVGRAANGNRQGNRVTERWGCSVVQDGTTNGGYEINTSPACGDALADLITETCEALAQDEVLVHSGCGLHVHIDARDFGYLDMQRLVRVYAVAEEALFAAVDPSRYNNGYASHCGEVYYRQIIRGCKPVSPELKKAVVETVYGQGTSQARATSSWSAGRRVFTAPDYYTQRVQHRAGNRTYAMNLHSWYLRGTVEFRLHHATIDPAVILGWMGMLTTLFDVVNSTNDSKLRRITEQVDARESRKLMKQFGMQMGGRYVRDDVLRDRAVIGMLALRQLLPEHHYTWLASRIERYSTGVSEFDNVNSRARR